MSAKPSKRGSQKVGRSLGRANTNVTTSVRSLTRAEMIGDFRRLFETVRDNYPFLWSKARYEGYDWVAHEKEFEESVLRASADDQFARAIYRMVKLLNNGHTNLAGERGVRTDLGNPAKRWVLEAQKTTPEKAGYWANLAGPRYESGWFTGREPFTAVYCAGLYVVAGVSPDPEVFRKVKPGSNVVALNGEPIHDFVARQRGECWLKYDPLRQRVYVSRLVLPRTGDSLQVAFATAAGSLASVELPSSVDPWPDPYPWPPRYAGHTAGSSVYMDVIEDKMDRDKVGYVQVRQMGSRPEDPEAMRAFFERTRDLPALIIDIRGNWGGSDLFWIQNLFGLLASSPALFHLRIAWRSGRETREFLDSKLESLATLGFDRSLLRHVDPHQQPGVPPEIRTPFFDGLIHGALPLQPMDSVNYGGRVFVLVDDGVFSSAETFAAFCKESGWATLVGECTGGDGIGFDPSTLTFPNSGMYILYSTTLGLNPDWSVNEQLHTRPDVLIERAPGDLLRYIQLQSAGPLPGPDPSWDTALRECLRRALGCKPHGLPAPRSSSEPFM